MNTPTQPIQKNLSPYWPGIFISGIGWFAIFFCDGWLDLSSLGLLLVLTSALVAVFFPLRLSLLVSVVFILAFDWFFIPPRGSFRAENHQYAFMLCVIFIVNSIVAAVMARQRAQAERAAQHAKEAELLRHWGERLQQSPAPIEQLQPLQELLAQITARAVTVMVLKDQLPTLDDMHAVIQAGDAGIEQRHALWYCTRQCQPLGRGTGRYELFSDVYLPLRSRGQAYGAVLIPNFAVHEFSTRIHLQTICDQFGQALERYQLHEHEIRLREAAEAQRVRTTLLAAISHDYRTPLATIMGAASSLDQQAEKLSRTQAQELAQRIFDEAARLNVITNNILQLARLDSQAAIDCDWQSADEIIASLRHRWREPVQAARLLFHTDNNAPLLWCDAILIGLLLENLIENALKYSPENSPVIVQTSIEHHYFLFAVIDKGKGIDEHLRTRIFEPFQRGIIHRERHADSTLAVANTPIAGAGVGLALCRAIAEAHHGKLMLECPTEGGSRFTFYLPLRALPIENNQRENQ